METVCFAVRVDASTSRDMLCESQMCEFEEALSNLTVTPLW
jgi:hypothetical protein